MKYPKKNLVVLVPSLISLFIGVNLMAEGIYGESLFAAPTRGQVAEAEAGSGMYTPGQKTTQGYVKPHSDPVAEALVQQFRNDRIAIEQARQADLNALKAEQKRREEYQRQTDLAPSRAINSCNNGDMNMCFLVGYGYENGSTNINNFYAYFGHDDFKAVQFYTKACNGGNMKGCSALGTMYKAGKGTPQNKDKAAELFTKACNANDATACNNLGTMYQNGYGFFGSKSKAKELYKKACQLRSQAGCNNYANLNQ